MVQLAEENNVELFQLLPHMTHHMQPLDVGIFGPLQWWWMERCDDVLEKTGEEIQKVDFIKEYMAARELVFLPETIKNTWQISAHSIPRCSPIRTVHPATALPPNCIFLKATPNDLDTWRGKRIPRRNWEGPRG